MIKRFYVGARHIGQAIKNRTNASCMHEYLVEAIQEAEDKVRTGEVECAVVVQVIKIVKRSNPPIEVLDPERY